MNSEEKKLHDIGIADFVLTDLMLYLDTHPSDQKAMEYFKVGIAPYFPIR